jgi:hypothetical protein
MTSRYGATGDATKNVTIAGHANKLAYTLPPTMVYGGYAYTTPLITVDGYSKLTVCIYCGMSSNFYRLSVTHIGGDEFFADTATNFGDNLVRTYDVPTNRYGYSSRIMTHHSVFSL